MCTHHNRAVGLEHGDAHDDDHQAWTRRDFLVRSGLAAAGASVLGASPAQAFAAGAQRFPGLVGALGSLETRRVLVMVQLVGGNDGLNTIIPVTNDIYYNARPDVAITGGDHLPWLSDEFRLHEAMAPLHRMWGDGHFGVVQSVGYESQKLSHFGGIDAWATARTGEGRTGWTAEATHRLREPGTLSPPAVQMAASYPLFSRGPGEEGPMTLSRPEHLDRLVNEGGRYTTSTLPETAAGQELAFLRRVSNDADTYAQSMIEASANSPGNAAEYPDETFGQALAAVARLIKGDLGTRVYLVRLGTFDTHAGQGPRHHALLDTLAQSLAAFYQDLGATGDDERTLTMTFSEFGRRVNQNGSAGTDHGTAAPVFLFGPAVSGGFHGTAPDLANLDSSGNLPVTTDFREVYATVLQSWLGLGEADSTQILGGGYASLGLLSAPDARFASGASSTAALPLALAPPAPNPLRGTAALRFSLPSSSNVQLDVYDIAGRHVATVASGRRGAGEHVARLDAGALSAGTYVLHLVTDVGSVTQTATVVR